MQTSRRNILPGIMFAVTIVLLLICAALQMNGLKYIIFCIIPMILMAVSCFAGKKNVLPIIASASFVLPLLYYGICLTNMIVRAYTFTTFHLLLCLVAVILFVVCVIIAQKNDSNKAASILLKIDAFIMPLIYSDLIALYYIKENVMVDIISYYYENIWDDAAYRFCEMYGWYNYTLFIYLIGYTILYIVGAVAFFSFARWMCGAPAPAQPAVYAVPQPQYQAPVYQVPAPRPVVYQPVQQPVYQQPVQPVYRQPVYRPVPQSAPAQASGNDQLKSIEAVERLKGLLDSGAITQEEFDAKKKEILGL